VTDPYAEIDALRRRLRAIEKAAGIVEEPRTYTTSELEDRELWRTNKADILAAAREGRIVESEPVAPPPPVEYPESIIPGWKVTGQDMYEAPAAPKVKGQKP
jgi:hypothetical protein